MTQTSKRSPGRASDGGCCGIAEAMPLRLLRALCDPNRIAILARLAASKEPLSVSAVAERMTIDISVVSRHLAMLRDAGAVEAEKRGKEVFYTARAPSLARTLRTMADAFASCCPGDGPGARCGAGGRKRKDEGT